MRWIPPPSSLWWRSLKLYIFTETCRIAFYKSTVYFSRCLFVRNGRRVLEENIVIALSLIHIAYRTHKRQSVHEIFRLCGGQCLSFGLKLIYSVIYLYQRAKGPLEICLFYGYYVQTWDKMSSKCTTLTFALFDLSALDFQVGWDTSTLGRTPLLSLDVTTTASLCGHFTHLILHTFL